MQDAATLRERAKVSLVKDEALAKLLPVRVTTVEVAFTDGSSLSERVSAVRGTPRNPMSHAEVVAKANDLMAPVVGSFNASRLIEAVYAIDSLTDLGMLKPFLQKK
jgi:2-methylcitrate dehydratase PrpD